MPHIVLLVACFLCNKIYEKSGNEVDRILFNEEYVWLSQEEKLPYAFYVSDHELAVELGSYLQKNKGDLLNQYSIYCSQSFFLLLCQTQIEIAEILSK